MSDSIHKLACSARVHGMLDLTRNTVSLRCVDKRCPHAAEAKRRGVWAVHVYSLRTGRIIRNEYVDPGR